jgi:4-aminobutyrate aminotransferase-like enzyme
MGLGVKSTEIEENINKLFSSILLEQQKYNQVKAPDEDKTHLIAAKLEEFSQLRGRGFFYNYISSGVGHGPFSQLIDGSVKFDLITGIGVNILGHSHPLVIKAHLETATKDIVSCGNLLPYQDAFELKESLLKSVSKSSLKHFWYAGSGSFANDNALKMIWQKQAPKYRLISFQDAFAGRSIATQEITSNPAYRVDMPSYIQVDHVPHYDYKDPENALEKTMNALNDLWSEHGNEYCAIQIELIQGEGGFIYGTTEYYKAIFEWAKERKIYIWVDEVQSFARTYELFAFQTLELDEYVDIVTVGKALQVCGTLYTEELNPKPGLISGTFNGSLAAINTGIKTLQYLTEGNFYGKDGRIKQLENQFTSRITHLAQNSCKGKIGNVGGIGLMLFFEVGNANKEDTTKVLKELFKNGIIAFSAGRDPVRVRFLLPLTITNEHIDQIVKIIDDSVNQVITLD